MCGIPRGSSRRRKRSDGSGSADDSLSHSSSRSRKYGGGSRSGKTTTDSCSGNQAAEDKYVDVKHHVVEVFKQSDKPGVEKCTVDYNQERSRRRRSSRKKRNSGTVRASSMNKCSNGTSNSHSTKKSTSKHGTSKVRDLGRPTSGAEEDDLQQTLLQRDTGTLHAGTERHRQQKDDLQQRDTGTLHSYFDHVAKPKGTIIIKKISRLSQSGTVMDCISQSGTRVIEQDEEAGKTADITTDRSSNKTDGVVFGDKEKDPVKETKATVKPENVSSIIENLIKEPKEHTVLLDKPEQSASRNYSGNKSEHTFLDRVDGARMNGQKMVNSVKPDHTIEKRYQEKMVNSIKSVNTPWNVLSNTWHSAPYMSNELFDRYCKYGIKSSRISPENGAEMKKHIELRKDLKNEEELDKSNDLKASQKVSQKVSSRLSPKCRAGIYDSKASPRYTPRISPMDANKSRLCDNDNKRSLCDNDDKRSLGDSDNKRSLSDNSRSLRGRSDNRSVNSINMNYSKNRSGYSDEKVNVRSEPKPEKKIAIKRSQINLFVGNISPEVTEDDLRDLFSRVGNIQEIQVKGRYGFAQFASNKCAARALDRINGKILHKKALRLEWAASDIHPKENDKSMSWRRRSRGSSPESSSSRSTRSSGRSLSPISHRSRESSILGSMNGINTKNSNGNRSFPTRRVPYKGNKRDLYKEKLTAINGDGVPFECESSRIIYARFKKRRERECGCEDHGKSCDDSRNGEAVEYKSGKSFASRSNSVENSRNCSDSGKSNDNRSSKSNSNHSLSGDSRNNCPRKKGGKSCKRSRKDIGHDSWRSQSYSRSLSRSVSNSIEGVTADGNDKAADVKGDTAENLDGDIKGDVVMTDANQQEVIKEESNKNVEGNNLDGISTEKSQRRSKSPAKDAATSLLVRKDAHKESLNDCIDGEPDHVESSLRSSQAGEQSRSLKRRRGGKETKANAKRQKESISSSYGKASSHGNASREHQKQHVSSNASHQYQRHEQKQQQYHQHIAQTLQQQHPQKGGRHNQLNKSGYWYQSGAQQYKGLAKPYDNSHVGQGLHKGQSWYGHQQCHEQHGQHQLHGSDGHQKYDQHSLAHQQHLPPHGMIEHQQYCHPTHVTHCCSKYSDNHHGVYRTFPPGLAPPGLVPPSYPYKPGHGYISGYLSSAHGHATHHPSHATDVSAHAGVHGQPPLRRTAPPGLEPHGIIPGMMNHPTGPHLVPSAQHIGVPPHRQHPVSHQHSMSHSMSHLMGHPQHLQHKHHLAQHAHHPAQHEQHHAQQPAGTALLHKPALQHAPEHSQQQYVQQQCGRVAGEIEGQQPGGQPAQTGGSAQPGHQEAAQPGKSRVEPDSMKPGLHQDFDSLVKLHALLGSYIEQIRERN